MSRADSWALMRDAQHQSERKAEMTEQAQITFSGGDADGKRHAWVEPSPPGEPGRWLCWRKRADGSLDLVTAFFFKRSAGKAAERYEHDGTMKGWNF